MTKWDILTPIGITLGFIMIVFGGVIGSMLITFKFEQIKLTGTVVWKLRY